jgi:hypothetical protein
VSEEPVEDVATDPVEAVKADIDATRAELQDTVNELSDRLNPKKQLSHATGSIGDAAKRAAADAGSAAKHGATQAQSAAKQGAAQAQSAAKQGVNRAQHVTGGRARQVGVVCAALVLAGVIVWRRRGRK